MTKATFEGVNYEVREGTGGNDRLIEGLGRDWIKGGAGNDTILDRLGDNLFDGGAGSDSITGGIGKDRFIHRLTENVGSADRYEGGLNTDTLRLELTAAEWGRADVQADIAGFLAHVATTKNKLLGLVGLTSDYKFTSTNLTVSNIEKLEIRVNGVAFDPTDQKVTAVGETFTISSAAAASINLLANDTVPDRVATISFATLPGSSYGSIAFAPSLGGNAQTANLTFTPGAGYTALKADEVKTETFTYTIKDVDGDTATATATIKIVGVNDGPVAVADSATTNEDTTVTIDVLANDTDPDGDSLTIVSATGPNGKGTVSVVDNKLVFDPGQAFQALGTGQSEAVELSYIVKDMQGVQSTATAMMTVTGIDDGPVYDEQFIGTIGNDIFYQFTPFLPSSSVRFSGNSFISTFSGDDSVYGDGITTSLDVDPLTSSITSGNDYIDSGEGDDVAIGDYVIVGNTIGYMNPPGQIPPDFNIQNYFTGNDILNGGDGNDQLMGDVDIASLYPRAVPNGSSTNVNFGDDSISGGVGNDEIIGDSRFFDAVADGPFEILGLILGAASAKFGNDSLIGGFGDDFIWGDVKFGSANKVDNLQFGDDYIDGGEGNDYIFGDGPLSLINTAPFYGNDIFVFDSGSGNDTINDFGYGADKLDVSGYGFTAFSQISHSVVGTDTIIDLDGDPNANVASITLKNYTSLSASDFMFA